MRLCTQLMSLNVVVTLMLCSCKPHIPQDDFDFARLVGRWSSVHSEASQIEEWAAVSDSAYAGLGYVLEAGDTTFFESLEIRKESGVWTYYAKVNQMNGGEIIPFRLSKQTPERVEFSNLSHDFPQKIGYEFISKDALQAYIEGPRDGQTIRIIFDFNRKL